MTDNIKYILIYPESHEHLGLFRDLSDNDNVELIVARQKTPKSKLARLIKRIHLSWSINKRIPLPFKRIWYEDINLDISSNENYCIIVVDGALRMLQPNRLNALFSKNNVRGVLVLLNSMEAQSVAILSTKDVIPLVKWDDVYTFDQGDAQKYHFKELGCCYYSMMPVEEIEAQSVSDKRSQVYFTGTIKGGREQLIMDVYERLHNADVATDFNIMITGERRLRHNLYEGDINYYAGRWLPYDHILMGVMNSEVILEVVQEGQNGPSLRYYEAVCYNKRLLTNNPNIKSFPYYNENYMRIFHDADDIDIDWIKNGPKANYDYKGEFSPRNMLRVINE